METSQSLWVSALSPGPLSWDSLDFISCMQLEFLSLQFVVLLLGTSKKSTGLFSVWCTVSMEVQFSHPPSPSLLQAEQCQLLIDHIPQFHHHPLSPSAGLDFIGSSCTGGSLAEHNTPRIGLTRKGTEGKQPLPSACTDPRFQAFTLHSCPQALSAKLLFIQPIGPQFGYRDALGDFGI